MISNHKDRSFFICSIVSLAATSVIQYFHLSRWWPWLDLILAKAGGVGIIGLVVLWITIWVACALVVRVWRSGLERSLVLEVRSVVTESGATSNIDRFVTANLSQEWRMLYAGSQLRNRLTMWSRRAQDFNRSERLSFLMTAQSSLEAAAIESAYSPLRALVWALPGLGFMGTALEMSRAVQGIKGVGSVGSDQLLKQLTEDVIPSLGGAFQITLLALGSSVICFVLLSLCHRREDRVLQLSDALSLDLLSSVEDKRPSLILTDDTANYLATGLRDLRTVLQVLDWELNRLRNVIVPFNDDDD